MDTQSIGKWFWALGLVFLCGLFPASGARAASADITVFTRAEDICVGDTFYVMISVVSDMPVSDVELTIPIDSKKFKFTTGGDVAAATKSKITITDIGSETAENEKIYALGFEAKKKGDFVFHIESPFAVYAYDESSDSKIKLSVSSNELPITILKKGAVPSATPGDAKAGQETTPGDAPGGGQDGKKTEDAPDGGQTGSEPGDAPDGEKSLEEAGETTQGKDGEETAEGETGVNPERGKLPESGKVYAPKEAAETASPSPSVQDGSSQGVGIWTSLLIGIIVIVIIGALVVAGYFIVKLLR